MNSRTIDETFIEDIEAGVVETLMQRAKRGKIRAESLQVAATMIVAHRLKEIRDILERTS